MKSNFLIRNPAVAMATVLADIYYYRSTLSVNKKTGIVKM